MRNIFCLCLFFCCYTTKGDVPLRLLAMVPFPDPEGGWDRGIELLPAARVAVKEVNSDQYTLPGYRLELIERGSDACARSVIRKGLSNLIVNSLSPPETRNNSIAVVGLACSTVTASVSPIAGREEVSLLQLAMANSNIFRSNFDQYPHLWRFLATSDHLVLTFEAFAKYIGWDQFGLIFDGQGFFFNAIATTFRDFVERNDGSLLLDRGLISSDDDALDSAIDLIQSSGVRVIFCSTTIPETIEIMCQAAKKNLIWPSYVWVFPSRSYSEFASNSHMCDEPTLMLRAIENVLLIRSEIVNTNLSSVLLTGRTYREYLKEYEKESAQLQKEEAYTEILQGYSFDSTYNTYANLMYNEIWALALALNDSLPEIAEQGFDLSKYQFNQAKITTIIEKNLKKVSFQGTLGLVEFDEFRETGTDFEIRQIRNSSEAMIGRYQNANLQLFNISKTDIPEDEFKEQYRLINEGLAAVIYTQAILLFIFVTVLFILLVLLRKEPEVRASSPLLSIHIFIGCYLLLVASVLLTTRQYAILSSTVYQIVCYIGDLLGYTGLNLVSATILLRLARVYRIFTKVTKITWVWKNKSLFVCIVLMASVVPVLFTALELAVDPKQCRHETTLDTDMTPPTRMIRIRCFSEYADVFETIIIIYAILIIMALLTLAVLTRNIDKKHFNDTKKVMAFVFLFTVCGTVFVPISYILRTLGSDDNSVVVLSYMDHMIILICLVFLIMPKVVPTFYYRYCVNKERNVHEEQDDEDVTISRFIFSPLVKKIQAKFGTYNSGTSNTTSQLPVVF